MEDFHAQYCRVALVPFSNFDLDYATINCAQQYLPAFAIANTGLNMF